MLLKLSLDCNNQLIRHHLRHNHPCHSSSLKTSQTLESRLEDDFYFDDEDDDADDDDDHRDAVSSRMHHPHEDFEPFYDDYHDEHNEALHFPRMEPTKKKIFKPPFYAEVAGYHPIQGVILNPKDSSFFPGLEPGGLAGITPKFIKFLRGHVKNVGKKKSIP